MSEKMREAVAILADEMRSELTDDGASLPQWLVNSWVRLLDKALAEQPDREKYSTFANGENSVETHAGSRQPAQGEEWRRVIVDVMADISDHSSLAYEKLRALLQAAPPAPIVPDEMAKISAIAHDGGLAGLSESDALAAIRRITAKHWSTKHETVEARRALVLAAAPEVPS